MSKILYHTVAVLVLFSFQGVEASAAPPERSGFTYGLGVGAGTVSLDPGPDLSLAWRVGYRFSNRIALVLTGASTVYDYDGIGRPRKRGFESLFPSIQYWATPRLWVAAGAGLQLDAPVFYDIEGPDERCFHRGLGAAALVGYEVHRTRWFGIEVLARVHGGYADVPGGRQYGSSASLLVGISR